MRHTRNNKIWIGNEKFELNDIITVFPDYALPDNISFAEENCGFIESETGIKQVNLTQDFKNLCIDVESKIEEIKAAKIQRINKEIKDEEDKIKAEYDALPKKEKAEIELEKTDNNMIRVVEDLIDVLISKGTIVLADLPESVQNKLAFRKSERLKLK